MVNELIKIIVLIYLVYLHMPYTQSFTSLFPQVVARKLPARAPGGRFRLHTFLRLLRSDG